MPQPGYGPLVPDDSNVEEPTITPTVETSDPLGHISVYLM